MSKKLHILVTGGAGFIGSHIVDAYIKAGHKVTVIDNLVTGKKEFVNKKANFVKKSIANKKDVDLLFKKNKFDVVNHHAAQIDVRKSVSDPLFDANTNIVGSLNLLENAVKYKCRKFIFISSGGVMYGECARPKDETTKPQPLSPYGISKLSIEYYLNFYNKINNLPFTILRYGNVYGPRQNLKGEAGVVAIFSQRMLKNEEVYIFGDGKQERDYVYIADVVDANLKALHKGSGEIINIGTQKTLSVNELFEKMLKNIDTYKKKPINKSARDGELQRSILNIKKSKKVLNWRPTHNTDNALKKTIDYYKNQRGK